MFNRILGKLAAQRGGTDKLMIHATHLKAHRTAASLLKKNVESVASNSFRFLVPWFPAKERGRSLCLQLSHPIQKFQTLFSRLLSFEDENKLLVL
ncbi:hypothetical protein [Neomesorhizobium albiziae]|uniref:hypothetical protein n=1 Tax=Neomesorhizobium albiziae TaxID=335020 RepID=UPI001AEF0213